MNIASITIIGKRFFAFFVTLYVLLIFCSLAAYAQYCPGSEMAYVVRDPAGKIINPATLNAPDFIEESTISFSYAEAEKEREGYWRMGEAVKSARKNKQGNLDKETGVFYALRETANGACSFSKPIIFKLTLGAETMNLVFRFAAPKNDSGEVYIVDSLPFQQGTFEIDLPEKSDYYAPSAWRKTSDEAEKPAPIAKKHIRGRVINALTKKPIESAVVYFKSIPGFIENKSTIKTNADGRFALENLRGDTFEKIIVAAVFVEHADFVVGTHAYLFQKDEDQKDANKALVSGKNQRLASQDDLTIELTPLVTVSGRVVEAESSKPFPSSEEIAEKFTISVKYGESGYLGGNFRFPQSDFQIHPQPDGSFTFKTAPGKNEIAVWGKHDGKNYVLAGSDRKFDVPAAGLNGLILKYERDPSEVKKEFDALLKQANEHFAAGRYDASLKLFQEAARLKPKETTAHYGVIQNFLALKRLDEAVSIYRQAVADKPDNAVAQYALGLSLDRAGKLEEAVKHYKEAVRLAPAVALHRYNLGNTLGTLGQSEAAIAELKEAVRLAPKYVDAHTVLGMEYHALGRFEESIAHLSDALRLDPTNEYALPSRSPTYLVLNRGAESAADAEKFIAAHGWKHEQSVYMALFGSFGYRLSGKEAEARKLLETAAKNIDTSRWVAPAVQYLLGAMSADDLLKLAIDNDKMTEARAYIGMNLLLSGKREEALPHLRWVIENGNKTFHEYFFVKAALERQMIQ